jgi:hypothetical protein
LGRGAAPACFSRHRLRRGRRPEPAGGFNFKRIWTRTAAWRQERATGALGDILLAASTEKLAIISGGEYLGKDDPVLLAVEPLANAINGAPISYWSGNWHGGEGENPMRYLGGLMGGSWLALLTSDLGNGMVDGAHFVANFECLNPANTLWSKYYHLFANVDTEPPRFLDFERWWGAYFLMNEAELRWILDNLFVGNRLARGEAKAAPRAKVNSGDAPRPLSAFPLQQLSTSHPTI